jgi:hypothetical protein
LSREDVTKNVVHKYIWLDHNKRFTCKQSNELLLASHSRNTIDLITKRVKHYKYTYHRVTMPWLPRRSMDCSCHNW